MKNLFISAALVMASICVVNAQGPSATEEKTDNVVEPAGDKCFLAVYAYVRSYSTKDNEWLQNTYIFPEKPLSVEKKPGVKCKDMFKSIKKDMVARINKKFNPKGEKKKYMLTNASIKIKEYPVFGNAESYIKEIKRQATRSKERMVNFKYTYTGE